MLRIYNKTDNVLPIGNRDLPEGGSIDIDIPYTSNLKMMEKCNMIAVVEIQQEEQKQENTTVKRKRKPRKANN